MTELRNAARGANEWADTYGNMGTPAPARLIQIPLHLLDPWEDSNGEPQPFRPYTSTMLVDLAENIRRNGIIQPINARPRPNGRFQIIAGHNRVTGAKMVGLPTVPALVQDLDDNQAAILMVDSNLKTRQHILPSERARAYKLRMEKLSHQGRRTDLTSGPMVQKSTDKNPGTTYGPLVHKSSDENPGTTYGPLVHKSSDENPGTTYGPLVHKSTSRDIIAEETGINARQIQRYLRLNDLHPDLLNMVDNGSLDKEKQDHNIPVMALRTGIELSYIPLDQQELILSVMLEHRCKAPSMSQAEQLRRLASVQALDKPAILSIMVKAKAPQEASVKLPAVRIYSFFPPNTPIDQIESEIYAALLAYRKNAKED